MNNELFKAGVKKLQDAIEAKEKVEAKIKKAKHDFNLTIVGDVEALGYCNTGIETLKTELGKMAIAEFNITKVKKYFGGIGIAEKKTMSYPTEDAFKYAKEKDMFILFDEKSFNKVAAALSKSDQLPFKVKTDTTPAATFPKVIKLEDK